MSGYFDYNYEYMLGLWFIFLVSVIWAGASILVQYLYTNENFDSPFLLTYIGSSLFTILLPTRWIGQRVCPKAYDHDPNAIEYESLPVQSPVHDLTIEEEGEYTDEIPCEVNTNDSSRESDIQTTNSAAHPTTPARNADHQSLPHQEREDPYEFADDMNTKWTNHDHLVAALKIAPIWFVSNWAYNASLLYTTITSSTVLASTGSLFTFIFAAGIFKNESYTHLKFLGVILGMLGSIITGLHDANVDEQADTEQTEYLRHLTAMQSSNFTTFATSGDTNVGFVIQAIVTRLLGADSSSSDDEDEDENKNVMRMVWGDGLGLLSAVGYGLYAAMVRVLCPEDESRMSVQLFLGYVGLCNALALSPIAIYQVLFVETGGSGNASDEEPSSSSAQSLTWIVFGLLVVKGLLDNVLSDYLWARAVILTSATVATVGLGLTIPLAFVSDIWMGKTSVVDPSSVGGALSVLAGFVLVNIGHTSTVREEASTPQTPEQAESNDPGDMLDQRNILTEVNGGTITTSIQSNDCKRPLQPMEYYRNDRTYQNGTT